MLEVSNTQKLTYYIKCFIKLKRDNKNGGAPHKPVLLLSLIRLFESGVFSNQHIYIIPELVASFKTVWALLVETNHNPLFSLPFYHMSSEPFWKLIPNQGCEKWVQAKSSLRSLINLTTAINCAVIDDDLLELFIRHESREILKETILNTYFPKTKNNYSRLPIDDFSSSDEEFRSSEEYKEKIRLLKNELDTNSFQEEIFVRTGLFKREVLKIYNHTCAISGLMISSLTHASMIDACHIVPFAESSDNSLTNGIALCPNLHRAFDRGLISITDEYKVIVKTEIKESQSVYSLSQFQGIKIILPLDGNFYPAAENLLHHRKRFGF